MTAVTVCSDFGDQENKVCQYWGLVITLCWSESGVTIDFMSQWNYRRILFIWKVAWDGKHFVTALSVSSFNSLWVPILYGSIIKNYFLETSLALQWLRLQTSMQGAQVQFLVRALRSHMLHRMTLMLGKIEGRRGDNWGWDGWMASLTQWTWVWANSGR